MSNDSNSLTQTVEEMSPMAKVLAGLLVVTQNMEQTLGCTLPKAENKPVGGSKPDQLLEILADTTQRLEACLNEIKKLEVI